MFKCLNDHINPPNMIRLFASSAIPSIMAKNGTKENFSNIAFFERNFAEPEITLGVFLILYIFLSQDYT